MDVLSAFPTIIFLRESPGLNSTPLNDLFSHLDATVSLNVFMFPIYTKKKQFKLQSYKIMVIKGWTTSSLT